MSKIYSLIVVLGLVLVSSVSFAECRLEKNARENCTLYGEVAEGLSLCVNYSQVSSNPPKYEISGNIVAEPAGRFIVNSNCRLEKSDSGSRICGDYHVSVSTQNIPESYSRMGYRVDLVVESASRSTSHAFQQSRCEIGFVPTVDTEVDQLVNSGMNDCR